MTEQIKKIMDKLMFGTGLDGRIYLYYPEKCKDYVAKYKRDVTDDVFCVLIDWAFKYGREVPINVAVTVEEKKSGKKYLIVIKEIND